MRVLGVVVAAIIVIALATVLVNGRGPADLPADSPEAAVQDYLNALRDGDSEAALALLEPGTSCRPKDLDEATGYANNTRVELRGVTTRNGQTSATVEVLIISDASDLIPGSGWSEEHTFRLRHTDRWLIGGLPWPLYTCGAYDR